MSNNQPGIYVSVPDAFTDADKELRNFLKFEFKTKFSAKHRVKTVFSTDRLLVDLSELDPRKLNVKKMIKDCDYLKSILLKHPTQIVASLKALKQNSKSGIKSAEKIRTKIGLTEKASAKAGGGLLWLIIPLIVLGTSSGCATLNSNKPFKRPTTPTPPNPPDAGPQ